MRTSEAQPETLSLPKILDMRAARGFKSTLEGPLKAGGCWQIDASAVERISTACVQLLIVFFVEMKKLGARATLVSPSRAFKSAIADLGLEGCAADWKMEK